MAVARLFPRSLFVLAAAAAIAAALFFDQSRTPGTPAAELITSKKAGFGPAVGVSSSGRMLGEFEHQDALLIGVNELLQYHPDTLCEIVAAVAGRVAVIGLISNPAQEQQALDVLRARGV